MRTKQNTLLAGVAALALFAGTGVALAQQSPQGTSGTPGMSESSDTHAQPAKPGGGAGMEQHAQGGANSTDKTGGAKGSSANPPSMAKQGGAENNQSANKSAMDQNHGAKAAGHAKTTAQNKGNNGTQAKSGTMGRHENRSARRVQEHSHAASRVEHNRGSAKTAQGKQDKYRGLQANESGKMQPSEHAQGSHAQLTSAQKTKIRDTVIESNNAPVAHDVHFNVRVGTAVPRTLRIERVPTVIVDIYPAWRDYEYFVFNDEVIIVNPHSLRIVAVLPA